MNTPDPCICESNQAAESAQSAIKNMRCPGMTRELPSDYGNRETSDGDDPRDEVRPSNDSTEQCINFLVTSQIVRGEQSDGKADTSSDRYGDCA